MSKIGSLSVVLISLIQLVACSDSAEKVVQAAAQARWQALIGGHLEQAYAFYDKEFQQHTSLEQFRSEIRGVGLWHKAAVEAVNCESTVKRCAVKVRVSVLMKMRGVPEPIETADVFQELWQQEGFFSDWRYIKN